MFWAFLSRSLKKSGPRSVLFMSMFSLRSQTLTPLSVALVPLSGVDVIAKFAQLEFRYGDAERGRTMFDKVLTSYPKRTDLWSVFIDLMVKHGSQKDVR